MLNKINVTTKEVLDELYNDSALTMEGLREDSIPDFIDWIKRHTELNTENVYIVKGSVMNEIYMLNGTNAYDNDVNIVSVKLSDMVLSTNIITERFAIGGRWFDDVVDNNLRREKE